MNGHLCWHLNFVSCIVGSVSSREVQVVTNIHRDLHPLEWIEMVLQRPTRLIPGECARCIKDHQVQTVGISVSGRRQHVPDARCHAEP